MSFKQYLSLPFCDISTITGAVLSVMESNSGFVLSGQISNTNINTTNFTGTNAFITNLGTNNITGVSGIVTNFTTTNFTGTNVSVTNITGTNTSSYKFTGLGSNPTLSFGTLGTSTGSITGTNTAGFVSFTTGSPPGTNSVLLSVEFPTEHSTTTSIPYVTLTPASTGAAADFNKIWVKPSSTGGYFSIMATNNVLPSATPYTFMYHTIR